MKLLRVPPVQERLPAKTEISKFFISSQRKPFDETFSKMKIKVSKELSFSRKPERSEMLPSRHMVSIQKSPKPLNYIIFKAIGKKSGLRKQVHLWQVSNAFQFKYWNNAFLTRLKEAHRFLSLALS